MGLFHAKTGGIMLTLPAIILIALGLLLTLVGGVWGIVVAFRRSVVWGLCYLFVPFAALVFLFVAWADAKRAFWVNLAGVLMMASVFLLPDQGGLGLSKLIPLELDQLAKSSPAVPDALIQVSSQDRLAELTTREQALLARKAALDPQDDAAALDAVVKLARTEGILPALESAHAVAEAIKLAPTLNDREILVVNLSGRGDKDMGILANELKLTGK